MRARPDDVLGMIYFARVVEARSFTDAARSLGVSKSAVSARVARLEESLGVQLLHRTTRRLALTANGVRVYEHCARVVVEADAAAEIGSGASEVPRGTLRVHAPPGLARSYLTPAIGALLREHAGVRVDLRLDDHLPDLSMDDLDVAIVVAGRLVDSGLTSRRLARVRVVVCASPGYLRKRGIPFRPQDLVLHECVSHAVRQSVDDLRFHTDEGDVSMASLSRLVSDDARFVREAALDGLGIVMLPQPLVADDLAEGRLFEVLDDFASIELGVHALHPHGRLPPASVRLFLDHLAATFRAARLDGAPRRASPPPPVEPSRRVVTITEQDVRRLTSVAALYADVHRERAAQLLALVTRAKVTTAAKIPASEVTMSSRIKVRDGDGRERELSLVYPWDADRDRISVLSELGLLLLGAKIGASVEHAGSALHLVSMKYQPEAAGDHHL